MLNSAKSLRGNTNTASLMLMFFLLMGCALVGIGCSPGSLMYFLLPEPKEPARMRQLTSQNAERTPRVVVLTYAGLETRPEFIQADRQLADLLAKQLSELSRENKEHVTVISPRKIEAYKSNHHDWHQRDLREIGRTFDADYIVYLEINGLDMYERGSAQQLYRGRADLTIHLIDMKNSDESESRPFRCTYPSEARGPVQIGFDSNPTQFRLAFLTHVARELSWHFVRYPRRATLFTD